ncbi:hypothetical protein KCV07_g355, partial [Aureobasidium melanogenum]
MCSFLGALLVLRVRIVQRCGMLLIMQRSQENTIGRKRTQEKHTANQRPTFSILVLQVNWVHGRKLVQPPSLQSVCFCFHLDCFQD